MEKMLKLFLNVGAIFEVDLVWVLGEGEYGAFLNSFHPEVKRLIWRLELIKDKIGQTQSV